VRFLVWMCPGCGMWQARSSSIRFDSLVLKCVFCNKSVKFHDAKEGFSKVRFHVVDGGSACSETVRRLNDRKV
jgi:hypothetical protein